MADETTTLRRCRGSTRFGLAPHQAPAGDFPRQPSQKDGLGRMCTVHWNAYTAGLAREAKARLAAGAGDAATTAAADPGAASPAALERARRRRRPETPETPIPGAQGDAG